MITMNRIFGVCMMASGIALFAIAHMLEPYMDTLSGITLYAVAISTGTVLAATISVLVVYGALQSTGRLNIRLVANGDKL